MQHLLMNHFNPNEDTASIEYVKNQVDANGVPDNSDESTCIKNLLASDSINAFVKLITYLNKQEMLMEA